MIYDSEFKREMSNSVNGDLVRTFVLIIIPVLLLFYNVVPAEIANNNIGPIEMNHAGHVYPYMASVVSMTCLLIFLMLIICLGGNLG